MKNRKKTILVIVGTIGFIICSYFLYDHIMFVTTDNAQVEAPVVMLAPKVAGYVTNVKVMEGQKVKKDDILVEIDSRDYQNTLRQIKGELSSVDAKRKDAEKNYKRLSQLFSKGAVSQQQYDAAVTSLADFRSKYESLSAQVDQATLNLQNTKIKAPMDGFIAKKSVEIGQFSSPGIPLIGFVGATDRWVIANFKETEISHVGVGSRARISVDAINGKTYEGEVITLSAATGATFTLLPPDNATGNFTKVVQRVPVRIALRNISDQDIVALKAGLSVIVKVFKH